MSDPWYFVHRFEDDTEEYILLTPLIGMRLGRRKKIAYSLVLVKRVRVDITLLYRLRAASSSVGSRSTRSIVRSFVSGHGSSSVYIDISSFEEDDFRLDHQKNG